jgi:hypothetical protein
MFPDLLTVDPLLLEAVELELEPFKAVFPPETVDHLRQEALGLLSSHPTPIALVRALRPPPVLQESGVVASVDEPDVPRSSGLRLVRGGGDGT